MLVYKKTNIYFAIELGLREISFVVYVHALMTQNSCAVGTRNAILRNHLKLIKGCHSSAERQYQPKVPVPGKYSDG